MRKCYPTEFRNNGSNKSNDPNNKWITQRSRATRMITPTYVPSATSILTAS
ncbi:unnamed protein product [Tenebrio molitor]|nr:unnamed protein product [Tenebrio molitor]